MINTFSRYSPLFHPCHPPPCFFPPPRLSPPPRLCPTTLDTFYRLDNGDGSESCRPTGLYIHGGVVKYLVKILQFYTRVTIDERNWASVINGTRRLSQVSRRFASLNGSISLFFLGILFFFLVILISRFHFSFLLLLHLLLF